MTRSLAASLEAFILMLAVSVVHRLVAFDALAGGSVDLLSGAGLQALAVGIWSDVWVCDLVALVVLLLHAAGALLGTPAAGRAGSALLLFGLGVGAAVHQAY